MFDGAAEDATGSMLMGIDEEAAYRSAWGSGTPGVSYHLHLDGGFRGLGVDENTPPAMFNALQMGKTPDYKGPEFKPGRLASLLVQVRYGRVDT